MIHWKLDGNFRYTLGSLARKRIFTPKNVIFTPSPRAPATCYFDADPVTLRDLVEPVPTVGALSVRYLPRIPCTYISPVCWLAVTVAVPPQCRQYSTYEYKGSYPMRSRSRQLATHGEPRMSTVSARQSRLDRRSDEGLDHEGRPTRWPPHLARARVWCRSLPTRCPMATAGSKRARSRCRDRSACRNRRAALRSWSLATQCARGARSRVAARWIERRKRAANVAHPAVALKRVVDAVPIQRKLWLRVQAHRHRAMLQLGDQCLLAAAAIVAAPYRTERA